MSEPRTFVAQTSREGVLPPVVRREIAEAIRQWPDQVIEVTVRKFRRQRTSPQNRYIHAVVVPIMAEFFGDSLVETKRDLMGECWGWTVNQRGREVPIRPHTSEMSVEECAVFIEWVIPWAMSKWGVHIPAPNEVDAAAA